MQKQSSKIAFEKSRDPSQHFATNVDCFANAHKVVGHIEVTECGKGELWRCGGRANRRAFLVVL
jgi:hypothetical protein